MLNPDVCQQGLIFIRVPWGTELSQLIHLHPATHAQRGRVDETTTLNFVAVLTNSYRLKWLILKLYIVSNKKLRTARYYLCIPSFKTQDPRPTSRLHLFLIRLKPTLLMNMSHNINTYVWGERTWHVVTYILYLVVCMQRPEQWLALSWSSPDPNNLMDPLSINKWAHWIQS